MLDESADMADTIWATERQLEHLHFEVCTLYTHMKKYTNIKRHRNVYKATGTAADADMMRTSSECRRQKQDAYEKQSCPNLKKREPYLRNRNSQVERRR